MWVMSPGHVGMMSPGHVGYGRAVIQALPDVHLSAEASDRHNRYHTVDVASLENYTIHFTILTLKLF